MKTCRWVMPIFAALVISASLGETPSQAATAATEDLTELTTLADAIVEVEVVALHNGYDQALSLPFTIATLKVLKSYKGTFKAGDEVRCEYFGGEFGAETTIVPGQAKLNAGEHAVLLLAANKKRPENFRVLGGDLGVIRIEESTARRANGRFDFYVADASSLTGYVAVNSVAISTTQLGDLLLATLNTGRQVIEKPTAATAPAEQIAPVADAPDTLAVTQTPAPRMWPLALLAAALLSISWLLFRRFA
jgi:hypothetical protein